MGIYVPWLADAARLTGYPVTELAGWRARGVRAFSALEVVVCHHTAGPKTGDAPSLAVVRDGRAGLSGPLSQFVLGRSGTVYVVAAGACNHAGKSTWAGLSDLNSRSLGIEAEDDGDGKWTPEQLDCYPRLVAACLHYMRRDASRAAAHREVAIPAGRKVDPAGIDMDAFRARVAQLLTDPLRLIPRGSTAPATPAGPVAKSPTGDPVQTFTWPAGIGAYKLVCPVGKASQLVARGWLSLACDGEISSYDVWFQSDAGGILDFHGRVGKDTRRWWELPDGTTQITVHYTATGPVGAALEIQPK